MLLDDAIPGLAAKAAADDVAVNLDITPGVPHVVQAFAALLEEGDAALNRAARISSRTTPPRRLPPDERHQSQGTPGQLPDGL